MYDEQTAEAAHEDDAMLDELRKRREIAGREHAHLSEAVRRTQRIIDACDAAIQQLAPPDSPGPNTITASRHPGVYQ